MNTVAIVAIVAMFFAVLLCGSRLVPSGAIVPAQVGADLPTPAPEIILYVSPPQTVHLGLTLPDRNPRR